MNEAPNGTARDPVCGMMVDPATAAGRFDYEDRTYCFCCAGCLTKFRGDPGPFLRAEPGAQPLVQLRMRRGPAAGAPALPPSGERPHPGPDHSPHAPQIPAVAPGTIWVCPMDPEVRQDHPGACPKCGMALDPEVPSAAEKDNPELRDMTRRLWLAAAATLPLVVLTMGAMAPVAALHHLMMSAGRGSSWRWRRRSCFGRVRPSLPARGRRFVTAAPTCSP